MFTGRPGEFDSRHLLETGQSGLNFGKRNNRRRRKNLLWKKKHSNADEVWTGGLLHKKTLIADMHFNETAKMRLIIGSKGSLYII